MADKTKIFVSTTPFGAVNSRPRELFCKTGWEIVYNTTQHKLSSEEVALMAREVDGIVAGTEDLGPLMAANPRLKIISRVGIGLDSVPLAECQKRGIAVCYTPDAVTMAVAEFTIGAMIATTRYFGPVDRMIRRGAWQRPQGIRLGEAMIGLVGFGRIGSNVARLLLPFHPRAVLVNDIKDKSKEIAGMRERGLAIESATLGRILSAVDILSLHVPLSRQTRLLIGARELAKMKPNAVLLNTARGGLVDEVALHRALAAGSLACAAIDVFEREPYRGPLAELDNVQLTAHLGSCSIDCRARMEIEATEDLIRFFRGEPLRNKVPQEEYEWQL